MPGSLGQITVDYKRYGVGLAFTPTVLSGGLINLKIEPEVSQLDPGHRVAVGNGIVGAGADRAPRQRPRSSCATARASCSAACCRTPTTAPAATALARRRAGARRAVLAASRYQKNETDLVIIVTPHLVRPTRPGDDVKTPLDNTLPANDIDFFLMGKSEITATDARVAVGQIAASAHRVTCSIFPKEFSKEQPMWSRVKN